MLDDIRSLGRSSSDIHKSLSKLDNQKKVTEVLSLYDIKLLFHDSLIDRSNQGMGIANMMQHRANRGQQEEPQ